MTSTWWLVLVILLWIALASFGVVMAVAAVADDSLDWYLTIGPVIGATVLALGGPIGIFLGAREARRSSRPRPDKAS